MRGGQIAGLLVLAVLAGIGGLFAGSFVTHSGPPPWLVDLLSHNGGGQKLAQWWLDASAPAAPPGVQVAGLGDAAPDLVLRDLAGTERRLSQWRGKAVLVNFWATWCGPCREEMPALDAARKAFSANGVEVVGIALDDADSVRAFLAASPVSYPILLAAPGGPSPAVAFGNVREVLPYSVLVDRQGHLQRQHLGGLSSSQLNQWLQFSGDPPTR